MDSVQLLVEHIDQPGVIAIAKEDPDLPDDTYWTMTVLVPGATEFAQSRFPIGRKFEWSKKKNWRTFNGRVVWAVEEGRIEAWVVRQDNEAQQYREVLVRLIEDLPHEDTRLDEH